MEHVDGRPLSALLAEALPTSTVVRYGGQIADALAHSHQRGVIHRDLKSANIMVTTDGRVKVLDFGIAAFAGDAATEAATRVATLPGTIGGTTGYMAPEILKGAAADRRSDIWSLGVVMYEMARGERPFGGATSFEVTSAILRDEPATLPRTVDVALRGVIARCLAKDPALRYQHAGEVHAALEAIATVSIAGGRAVVEPVVGAVSVHEAPAEKSILVMPFANLSPDAADAYFADGLTDELITDLSRIAGLRVVPATASFRLRGTNKDPEAIARDFNVTHIVEGRVRKAGDDVRITAQLERF
jgi:serine/threonine protein kinase